MPKSSWFADGCSVFQQPILVLFTAKDMLLAVSVYFQLAIWPSIKNGDVHQLKKRFEKGEQQILLGAASFWEGVDFSGHPLWFQVVPRLPFQNPPRALDEKRLIKTNSRREKCLLWLSIAYGYYSFKTGFGKKYETRTPTFFSFWTGNCRKLIRQTNCDFSSKRSIVKTVSRSKLMKLLINF